MNAALSQQARQAISVLEKLIRTEEITIPSAAKLLKKSPRWVRANFPVIVHSHKSHHVRLVDVEAYQERRTVWPKFGRKAA
jgi:hypothetical protein